MKRIQLASLALIAAFAPSLSAQTPVPMKEEAPGLLKKAKVTPDAATATAMAKVPNGKLESREIEMENKKLIYSFAIKVPGKSGTEEVAIDALTGAVIAVEHETPEDEAKEAAADKAKADKEKAAKAAKPNVKPPKN